MLKILHTADWHLGHRLHGISREYEHHCFFDWLLQQIEKISADALLITGDIFDSANPPANAQRLFYDFLVQAKAIANNLDIVIIGGNHDSASRLDAPLPLLQTLGVHVVGGLTRLENGDIDWQRLFIPLTDSLGHIQAICGAMPFIRSVDLPSVSQLELELEGFDASSDPLIEGMAYLYQQLFTEMKIYEEKLPQQQLTTSTIKHLVTGHCYMVNTELSELSERRILGGNQHALPLRIFSDNSKNLMIDYVALGHLHKAQQITMKTDDHQQAMMVQYSGSIIPLSFSEQNYSHQVSQISWCVTQHSGDITQIKTDQLMIQSLKIPRSVVIKSIPQYHYASLLELKSLIAEEDFPSAFQQHNLLIDHQPMLEIKVLLSQPEPDLRAKIEAMLSDFAVRLLKISIQYLGKGETLAVQLSQQCLEELHPEDVFILRYKQQFNQPPSVKMKELFYQLLESVEEKK
jgi:exonuclease SbcD